MTVLSSYFFILAVLVPSFFRCVDVVKSSQYTELADDLEIIKAVTYLRQKDFNQVTDWAHFRRGPHVDSSPSWFLFNP